METSRYRRFYIKQSSTEFLQCSQRHPCLHLNRVSQKANQTLQLDFWLALGVMSTELQRLGQSLVAYGGHRSHDTAARLHRAAGSRLSTERPGRPGIRRVQVGSGWSPGGHQTRKGFLTGNGSQGKGLRWLAWAAEWALPWLKKASLRGSAGAWTGTEGPEDIRGSHRTLGAALSEHGMDTWMAAGNGGRAAVSLSLRRDTDQGERAEGGFLTLGCCARPCVSSSWFC